MFGADYSDSGRGYIHMHQTQTDFMTIQMYQKVTW